MLKLFVQTLFKIIVVILFLPVTGHGQNEYKYLDYRNGSDTEINVKNENFFLNTFLLRSDGVHGVFYKKVNFISDTFGPHSCLSMSHFKSSLIFGGFVKGECHFSYSIFDSSTVFESTNFTGVVDFDHVIFNSGVSFNSANFKERANFSEDSFKLIDKPIFKYLQPFKYLNNADFNNTKFSEGAHFEGAYFTNVSFSGSFLYWINLSKCTIDKHVVFTDAKMGLFFDCSNGTITENGELDLKYTCLPTIVNFWGVQSKTIIDLTHTRQLRNNIIRPSYLNLYNADIDKFVIDYSYLELCFF